MDTLVLELQESRSFPTWMLETGSVLTPEPSLQPPQTTNFKVKHQAQYNQKV